MLSTKETLQRMSNRYPTAFDLIEQLITPHTFFTIFQQLSDNYSPTLTVSRVQGALVEQIMKDSSADQRQVQIDRNLYRSGTIGVRVGQLKPAVWLSAHADICSYLTGPWDGQGYPVIPFCSHPNVPGRRPAMALGTPVGAGPLERLAEGEMVTDDQGQVRFEVDRDDLPLSTRVVHHLPAHWDPETDRVTGFLDNLAASTAILLVAQVLSRLDANLLVLINDEEEGPVDRGNQGFARASNRLLHRT
ncbi:MAG: hypothetical protein AAF485_27440, partial [Chloroflexota bacterium]